MKLDSFFKLYFKKMFLKIEKIWKSPKWLSVYLDYLIQSDFCSLDG